MFDKNGRTVPLTPKFSTWYITYVSHPRTDCPHFQRLFQRRFRLPHQQFLELVAECKSATTRFKQWSDSKDSAGAASSPLELMVLGALRYLGRGWTFDDLYKATAIHEETHRCFFHVFIEFGSTLLFRKYVNVPTRDDASSAEYEAAGLPRKNIAHQPVVGNKV
jgi:hypothetical protein